MKPSNSLPGVASIIIPSCNPLESTRQCIAALMRFSRRPFELIVVDDGSSNEVSAYLASMRADSPVPVAVIGNTANRGVPATINQGLNAARGEYLVVVSNDVVVTDSWLDQLIALANMNRASLAKVKGEDITAENAGHADGKSEGKKEISGDGLLERAGVCDVAISGLDGPEPLFEGRDVGRHSVASAGGVMRPAPNDVGRPSVASEGGVMRPAPSGGDSEGGVMRPALNDGFAETTPPTVRASPEVSFAETTPHRPRVL